MNSLIIVGTIINLIGIGFFVARKYPLIGILLLIVGSSICLKGRRKIDKP